MRNKGYHVNYISKCPTKEHLQQNEGGKNNCDDIIGSSFAEELRSFG